MNVHWPPFMLCVHWDCKTWRRRHTDRLKCVCSCIRFFFRNQSICNQVHVICVTWVGQTIVVGDGIRQTVNINFNCGEEAKKKLRRTWRCWVSYRGAFLLHKKTAVNQVSGGDDHSVNDTYFDIWFNAALSCHHHQNQKYQVHRSSPPIPYYKLVLSTFYSMHCIYASMCVIHVIRAHWYCIH